MIAAVQDANVLIDLLNSGLLEVSIGLGMAFHVVDVVVNEIKEEGQRRELDSAISNGWLAVDELDGAAMEQAVDFLKESSAISFQDAASLSLAQSLGAILLTGDQPLRTLAEGHLMETHGVLWLLDSLVAALLVDERAAATALETMLVKGARLPKDECTRRLADWQN